MLADIPGLIEGAGDGAGLGHEFLAHTERTRLLVHLVDIAPPDEADPWETFTTVGGSSRRYGAGLESRPFLVASASWTCPRGGAGDTRGRMAQAARGGTWHPPGGGSPARDRHVERDGRRHRGATHAIFAYTPPGGP